MMNSLTNPILNKQTNYRDTMRNATCTELADLVNEMYLAEEISTKEYDAFSWVFDVAIEKLPTFKTK